MGKVWSDLLIQFNRFSTWNQNLDSPRHIALLNFSLWIDQKVAPLKAFRQKLTLTPMRAGVTSKRFHWTVFWWVYLSSCLHLLCLTVPPEVQTRSQLWPDAVRRTLLCVYQPQFVFKAPSRQIRRRGGEVRGEHHKVTQSFHFSHVEE